MDNLYDYRKFFIVYVDDEEKSLTSFTRAFDGQFRILTATNAQDGLKLVEKHADEIGVVMTDQRMPGEKGVWLLEKTRQLRPRTIRLLATAYTDLDAAIAAVNSGAIYKYVTKPWDPVELETTLKRGLEFFLIQRERDHLLREKLSVLHNMMIRDRIVGLGILAAGMGHHIRNALVAVKTFIDLTPDMLREEDVDFDQMRNPDFWKDYYHLVQRHLDKITLMLKDLWTATETPKFEFNDKVNFRDIVTDVLQRLGGSLAQKNIRVDNQIPEALPEVAVDKPKIDRLFELLLKDEIAVLPPGSRVVISARPSTPIGDQAPSVDVELRDNGPGLPQEALRSIFDPFMLRNDAPMEYGVNLMASYLLVHHHGGRIEARSNGSTGTTFSIRLPIDPNRIPLIDQNQEFLEKVMLNESLWEKLLATA
jgi:two-component system probable response regulator PhcQ